MAPSVPITSSTWWTVNLMKWQNISQNRQYASCLRNSKYDQLIEITHVWGTQYI